MAISLYDHWYDKQMPRFLAQVVRAFSGFSYLPGIRDGVAATPVLVPCRMATQDRMVANILRNNSENTLLTVPMITVWQSGLQFDLDRVQYPGHVDTVQVVQRAVASNKFTTARGNSYTVQRLIGRPFTMKLQVDIWTSNQDQKYQLAEQILPIITPTFDIQNSDNPLDWSALTLMVLDDLTWSSKTMPVGADSEIDLLTLSLHLPVWLNPPAKVMAQKIIETIITNIDQEADDDQGGVVAGALMGRTITTPGDLHVGVSGGVITLLNAKAGAHLASAPLPSWAETIALYGLLTPTSEIRLSYTSDFDGAFVAGTIQLDPSAINQLLWTLDPATLPGNSLAPINALIDPLKVAPGAGLPAPWVGVAYLIVEDIFPSVGWGSTRANANDIITWDGTQWAVTFNAAASAGQQDHLLNLHTGNQLRWTGTGEGWVMAIDGTYGPGFWHLAL